MIKLLALNQKTCPHLSLSAFIKYSKSFHGVELRYKSIQNHLSNNKTLKNIKELLDIYETKLISISHLKDFSLNPEREYKIHTVPLINQMIKTCVKLEGDLLILTPSFLTPTQNLEKIPQWRIFRRTTKRLEDLSKKAKNEDIKLGFEFINMPNSSIKTLSEAKEVLKPLESHENLVYIIDTFYFAKSNSELNQLKDIKDLLYLVQISDLKYESLSELASLKESDRLLPGEGNYDLKKFIEFTMRIGYKRSFSIELRQSDCSDKLYKKFFKTF